VRKKILFAAVNCVSRLMTPDFFVSGSLQRYDRPRADHPDRALDRIDDRVFYILEFSIIVTNSLLAADTNFSVLVKVWHEPQVMYELLNATPAPG
jgi:hypothetical protein